MFFTIFLTVTLLLLLLFFMEPLYLWLVGYNDKYSRELADYFKPQGGAADPSRMKRIIVTGEVVAFVAGTLMAGHVFFGFWGLGFALFAVRYIAKLLHMREIEKFDSQMLDITYAFKNSLKAGMTLQQGMQLIGNEFTAPASDEFKIVLREIHLGASIEEALSHLQERMPNVELNIMVNAIEILRQTGGNMVETFETLAETLKNRKRVEGKIKSLTAQGRIQAIILCVMPFAMLFILYFLNREYVTPLLSTALGWVILTVVVMLVSLGWLLIMKIIAIEV